MALHDVFDNFAEQLEAITCTNKEPGRGFHEIDLVDTDPAADPVGAWRGFVVRWTGSTAAHEVEDMHTRTAWHNIEVDVYHPGQAGTVLKSIVADDRHDMMKRLRDDTYWETSTIGLRGRAWDGDELIEESPTVTIFRQRWRCLVSETE